MSSRSGPPHSPDTDSWRRNWKNPCMTCTTRFYMWRCSSNVLDHFLTLFFLSFTSQWMGFEALHLGVHRWRIWCHDTAFAISMEEDQDVILREQGIPQDGRHRKGMKHRESLPLNRGEAAHWSMEESPGRAEHRLTQGTKVKRQIPFLDEFPVQIRKLGVEMVCAVPGSGGCHCTKCRGGFLWHGERTLCGWEEAGRTWSVKPGKPRLMWDWWLSIRVCSRGEVPEKTVLGPEQVWSPTLNIFELKLEDDFEPVEEWDLDWSGGSKACLAFGIKLRKKVSEWRYICHIRAWA